MMAIAEPKILSRNWAIGKSAAMATLALLAGGRFYGVLNSESIPAQNAALLIDQANQYGDVTLEYDPRHKLPELVLLALGALVAGGTSALMYPKRVKAEEFTPDKVQHLKETGLLPYSPTEARSAFVEFFVGLSADYPYLTKMMGSHLTIVNGPSGARKSRTACSFALMQWINPSVNRTPYVLDAKYDVNKRCGTWEGIPDSNIIRPHQLHDFWKRIQKQDNWCIIIDEIDEHKNQGNGELISQIVRVSNTQPRKQHSGVIIVAHGDEQNGHVELTKDNLGLSDADRGKIAPVRKAANILTLGSQEDDFGKLVPTFQGTWKPGMCDDSQLRPITIPQNLDPSTFKKYVLPLLEMAREVVPASPVVAQLEDQLTDRESFDSMVSKFEKVYAESAPVDEETIEIDLKAVDVIGRDFLEWHFSQYVEAPYGWHPRSRLLTHWTVKQSGQRPNAEQVDRLFSLLEQAGVISQRVGDRNKKLYQVNVTKDMI